jgi:hypothetical protein
VWGLTALPEYAVHPRNHHPALRVTFPTREGAARGTPSPASKPGSPDFDTCVLDPGKPEASERGGVCPFSKRRCGAVALKQPAAGPHPCPSPTREKGSPRHGYRAAASTERPAAEFGLGQRLVEARIDRDLPLSAPKRRLPRGATGTRRTTGNDHISTLKRVCDRFEQVGLGIVNRELDYFTATTLLILRISFWRMFLPATPPD